MFGSLMNQAMAKFGGGKAPDRQPTPQLAAADANRSPMPKAGGKLASPSRPVQQGLWALVVITILGGALFYREHARFAELEGAQGAPASAAFLAVAPTEASEADGPVIKTEDGTEISVISPAAGASSGEVAAAAVAAVAGAVVSTEAAGGAAVTSLRSEVAALRQSLQRHEQMLRYIMDRYVERKGDAPGLPQDDSAGTAGVPVAEAHGHDAAAASANFSVPEFVSKSYDDEQHENRGKSKQRKQGDVGLGM